MSAYRAEYRILQFLLGALGAAAIGIGLMIFILGEQAVNVVANVYDTIVGQTVSPTQPISATIDSELRFYSTLWLSYGLLLVWVTRALVKHIRLVPILAGVFFLGGVGRILSLVLIGAPHPVFIVLMAIEIVFPILVGVLYVRIRPN
jgi:hypothetical protein